MGRKKTITARALVNLKYDKQIKKIGEELKVKITDAKEMEERKLIELLEDMNQEEQSGNDEEDQANENPDNEGE